MLPPIYPILSGNAAVVALAGNRIYPDGDAPQGIAGPYVTWFLLSGIPQNELDAAPSTDRCAVQIDCWGSSGADAKHLAGVVRAAIEPHACVTGIILNGREPETGLHRLALQIDYWLSR